MPASIGSGSKDGLIPLFRPPPSPTVSDAMLPVLIVDLLDLHDLKQQATSSKQLATRMQQAAAAQQLCTFCGVKVFGNAEGSILDAGLANQRLASNQYYTTP